MIFDVITVVQPAPEVSIDITAIDAGIGILVAPLVGIITGPNTPAELKSIAAILLSLAIGFIHIWLAGQWNPSQLIASIGALIMAAGIAHATVFGPIDRKLQENVPVKIGDKTV